MLPKNRDLAFVESLFGCFGRRWAFFVCCLAAWLGVTLGCIVPPLDLRCQVCLEDNTCGENNAFVCKEGLCVSRDNPDPTLCRSENNEGSPERTEPHGDTPPEETTLPEEALSPEDGAPLDGEAIHEQDAEIVIQETEQPYIERVNGNGTRLDANTAASPSKIPNLPAPTRPSPNRIKDALVIEGNLLDRIHRWVLQSTDSRNSEQTWTNDQIIKDSPMKHTLSLLQRNLVAGAFLLLGFSANSQVVSAQVFILQGEKGDTGAKGDAGPKGDGFDQTTLDFVKSLQSTLKPDTAQKSLDITADTVSFKPASAPKITLDLGSTATLKAGNATLDFSGDTITAKSSAFSVETTTFEVKGTNATTLKLDDAAKTVTFEKANVYVQNGSGKTDSTNSLGNLIIGYNKPRSSPPATYSRAGSHCIVIGDNHGYASYGGLVAGFQNLITANAQYSSVSGGSGNTANAQHSSVSGGSGNTANAQYSSVSGGSGNTANAQYSSVSGGQGGKAEGDYSSVSGGNGAVAGDNNNRSNSSHTQVCGGNGRNMTAQYGVACGP